jgi:hypothetical protein
MAADARLLHLSISNDGSDDTGSGPLAEAGRTGNGLRNLAARLEAAGGHQTATRETAHSAWLSSCRSWRASRSFRASRHRWRSEPRPSGLRPPSLVTADAM